MRFRLPSSLLPAATANRASSNDVDTPKPSFHERQVTEKEPGVNANSSQVIPEEEKMELQHGVASVEAVTEVCTKRDLIVAYGPIWVVQFMLAFSSGIVWTLTPYVTSSFQLHSLTATTSIISSFIGGLFKIPYAKILDIWGAQRPS
ncbi:hypothetical protein LTR67_001025 [Exophiala xenobiotica]